MSHLGRLALVPLLAALGATAAFAADGRMAIVVGSQRRPVEVPAAHLAKLRRFAELCSG